MIEIVDKNICCGCHACYSICTQQCISLQVDAEGFRYPSVDVVACNGCGLCTWVCPVLKRSHIDNLSDSYACINRNDRIRELSSSGGVFTLIAEKFIDVNGVVFGAGFDDDFNVVHSWTGDVEGLGKFRGSKYVQSCIGDTYKEAREFLKQGRPVLFSGTPCQIAGLRSYLGKDYENLLCLDIFCHGVPSPEVWQLYKQQVEQRYQAKIKRIAFRRKNCGWKLYSVSFSFDNGTEYSQSLTQDLFMRGFLQNLYLRPSCYACKFKTLSRQSDLTLADFWGIENIIPSLDDDKGTSLVLVNTEKGESMFENLADQMISEKVDVNQAIRYNSAAVKSVDYNPKRDEFLVKLAASSDICQLIAEYTKESLSRKAYIRVRRLLGRIKRAVIN